MPNCLERRRRVDVAALPRRHRVVAAAALAPWPLPLRAPPCLRLFMHRLLRLKMTPTRGETIHNLEIERL